MHIPAPWMGVFTVPMRPDAPLPGAVQELGLI